MQGKVEESDKRKAEKVAIACLNFRKAKVWTQKQLAMHLGISTAKLQEIERGKKIPSMLILNVLREKFN